MYGARPDSIYKLIVIFKSIILIESDNNNKGNNNNNNYNRCTLIKINKDSLLKNK